MSTAAARVAHAPDAREAARGYIARGYAVIDAPAGNKAPTRREWQHARLTADDLDPHGNIGLMLGDASGGLIDVDLDTPEAIAAALHLLPATEMRHGRVSTPCAHWWYAIASGELETVRYRDPDGTTLIELRSTGCQTIVPPSIHPSGELLTWEREGEPAGVTAPELRAAVAKVAVCALLARRWPAGARHDAALALAGFLLRRGVTQPDAERYTEAVARVADDPEWRDRVRAVRDTAADLAAGKPITGGPRLAELLSDGAAVVDKLCEWLKLDPESVSGESADVAPLDIFGDGIAGQTRILTPDLLPGTIARFAVDVAERSGVDLGAVGLPCLAVVAAAISDRHVVQPRQHNTDWTEAARVNVGIVADPGEKKTQAINQAAAPLAAKEREWTEHDLRARTQYEIDRAAYEAAVKDCARRQARGESAVLPVEPIKPPIRRRVVTDLTTEALALICADNPDGVLVLADELSGWFASHDAYRTHAGKDRSFWLDCFEGGPRRQDRVHRGSIYVENLSACIVGGIQFGPMRRLAGRITDDGLIQRFFVYFMAPSVADVDRKPDFTAAAAYRRLISELVDLPSPSAPYTFSAEARLEHAVVEDLARRLKLLPQVPDAMRGHLGKWGGLFARLALIYHLSESTALEISGETASRVARLFTDVLLPHAAKFYAELSGEQRWTHARWIGGYILAHRLEKLTARDIGKHYRALRGDKAETARAMETLEVAGWVTPIRAEYGLPTRWRVNSRVHTTFAQRAAEERERRERVREEIRRTSRGLGLDGDEEQDA